jgi:hypothetical protein
MTMDCTVQLAEGGTGYSWYATAGVLPSGSPERIWLPGYGDSEVVSLLGNPYNGRNIWGIATGKTTTKYQPLNLADCEVFFNRKDFQVNVNIGQRLISVVPIDQGELLYSEVLGPGWIQIQTNVVQQVGMVVQTSGAALSTPLGSGRRFGTTPSPPSSFPLPHISTSSFVYLLKTSLALLSNIANTQAAQINNILPASLNKTDINLIGISRSLEIIVDAILGGFASAQYVIAGQGGNGRMSVSTNATYGAVQIGSRPAIAVITGINVLIVLLFVGLVAGNRAWKGKTSFDYQDPMCLVIGTSISGLRNERAVEKKIKETGDSWTGGPKDRNLSDLTVLLKKDNIDQMTLLLGGS